MKTLYGVSIVVVCWGLCWDALLTAGEGVLLEQQTNVHGGDAGGERPARRHDFVSRRRVQVESDFPTEVTSEFPTSQPTPKPTIPRTTPAPVPTPTTATPVALPVIPPVIAPVPTAPTPTEIITPTATTTPITPTAPTAPQAPVPSAETAVPSRDPTWMPTWNPTETPTLFPTWIFTRKPIAPGTPTRPVRRPRPTRKPTSKPTRKPTPKPVRRPVKLPPVFVKPPVKTPIKTPVKAPSRNATSAPNSSPTAKAPAASPSAPKPSGGTAPKPSGGGGGGTAPKPSGGTAPKPSGVTAPTKPAGNGTTSGNGTLPVKPQCFRNTTEIYQLVLTANTAIVNTYVLCAFATFPIGAFQNGPNGTQVVGGMAPLVARKNVVYQCGNNGSVTDGCTINGGDIQILSAYTLFREPVTNCVIKGITFNNATRAGASLGNQGNIIFQDCIFQNHVNIGAMLLIWDPSVLQSVPGAAAPAANGSAVSVAVTTQNSTSTNSSTTGPDATKPRQKVTLIRTTFRYNQQGSPPNATTNGVITTATGYNDLEIVWSKFQSNKFSSTTFGQAVLVGGGSSVVINHTNFIDNNFTGRGTVNVFDGGNYTVMMNYGTKDDGLQCQFLAFSSAAAPGVTCVDYDLEFPITLAPTQAPISANQTRPSNSTNANPNATTTVPPPAAVPQGAGAPAGAPGGGAPDAGGQGAGGQGAGGQDAGGQGAGGQDAGAPVGAPV